MPVVDGTSARQALLAYSLSCSVRASHLAYLSCCAALDLMHHLPYHTTHTLVFICRTVAAIAEDPSFHLKLKLEPGDIEWLHNPSTFHARTAVVDGEVRSNPFCCLSNYMQPDAAAVSTQW